MFEPRISFIVDKLMDYFWPLLALIYLVIFAFLSKKFKKSSTRKVPPGPKPWPIIGNLNLIGSVPHKSILSLSQKYGEIMQLRFGKFPVVVASSPEMAKQFLRVHDRVFASRPALAAGKYISYNYSNVLWAPYNAYWREVRKIYLSEVFNARTLESYEQIRIEERRNFVYRLHALYGKPFVLREHLMRYTLTSISRMVFGNKYFSETEHENSILGLDEFRGMMDEWFSLNAVLNIGDWIPWLDFLDVQGYVKRMKDLHKKFDRFHEYVIDDHQERRKVKEGFDPKDVVDKLLHLAEDPNLEIKLSRDCIKGQVQDLLFGGTDTSTSAMEWAIHELIRHPLIIEKAKVELDKVIGKNKWVEEDDVSKLPYIEAIIMESLRLHPLTTFLPPHYATEDCNVLGYDIAKGTTIMINTWSLGRDSNTWDAHGEFLPERFLGKEVDMLGNNFALLPFGSGRRKCPGYSLGLKLVRTTLANLIHGFNWRLPEGMKVDDVCIEELYGLVTRPKLSLEIIMEPSLSIPYGP